MVIDFKKLYLHFENQKQTFLRPELITKPMRMCPGSLTPEP